MSAEVAVNTPTSLATKMDYAQAMASSNLLPQSYRNSPANILFALGYAEALGVAPIHAITSIHIINGKPSASADLIAATIRKAGHKLRVVGDDTYAEATLIRADDPDFEYVARWDIAKANQANLNTATWKAYPAAMLRSRAITEVGRMGATDALFGVQYTPEELGADVDQHGAPSTKAAPARNRVQQAMAEAAPEPAMEDLGERRDFLAEAKAATDVDGIRNVWFAAKEAGETQATLDDIQALATPVTEPVADEAPAPS